jgi:hypothetical protein
MALSADQRAMLGLLLERGQSYADISGLLGIGEDEVRSRARAALGEIGGEDPDRNVGLTDYLLGQADPIGRADAVRHLRDDPADHALAERILSGLAELAPGAELARLPGEARTAPHMRAPRRRRPAAPTEPAPGPAWSLPSLSSRRARLLVALGAGAVILVVVVLAVTGSFSGGGSTTETTASAPSTSSSATGTSTSPTTTDSSQTLTPVPLKSVAGSPGRGLATFGVATGNTPFLDIRTSDLVPAPNNEVYSVWLTLDPAKRQGYPVAPLLQDHNRFNIPSVVLPILPRMRSVDVVVSPASALQNEIQGVLNAKKPKLILPEPGNLALRGTIPKRIRG